MQTQIFHPMQLPTIVVPRIRSRNRGFSRSAMDGGFFDDLGDTLWSGVTGLTEALGHALEEIVHTIGQIGETIALIVRACLGDADWNDVLDSLGTVFQDIGRAMVWLDPTRQLFDWLDSAKLTSHAFSEWDKFTGGSLTASRNLSDLPGRVLRGDAISNQELIKDALFVIEVVVIIVGFPESLAIVAATMVGKEVCKHQTEARDACMVAFEIVGVAVGGWVADWSAASDLSLEAEFDAIPETGSIEDALNAADLAAGESGATAVSSGAGSSITAHLSTAAGEVLENQGIDVLTRQASLLCQSQKWAGRNECQILSQVVGDYIKSDSEQEWSDFLASEVARIGAEELMLQWFPTSSPEHVAIKKQWQIKYIDAPGDQVINKASINPWTVVLLAAGAAAVLMGGTT